MHQEIFSLTRVEEGEFKDNEWNLIVKPVIKKWSTSSAISCIKLKSLANC